MSHMNIFSCDAMLSIAKNIIGVEMTHHLRADDVFNHIRSDRCQRNMAIVASCGVVSLLGDGDNVRLLPLLWDCDLLKRCSVDGSHDWCQLVGCLLQKPGRDRIWAGRLVSLDAPEQFGYPVNVDINLRHRFVQCGLQLRHIIFVLNSETDANWSLRMCSFLPGDEYIWPSGPRRGPTIVFLLRLHYEYSRLALVYVAGLRISMT